MLRASHADREAAAARLNDAVGTGFLDLAEFDVRVRAVYAAQLRDDVMRLVGGPGAAVEAPRRGWRPGSAYVIGL